MKNVNKISALLVCVFFVSACTSTTETKQKIKDSFLKGSAQELVDTTEQTLANDNGVAVAAVESKFRFVPPLKLATNQAKTADDVLKQFSELEQINMAADALPLADFLHQVLGEQLNVSYILADSVNDDTSPVTLNLKNNISQRKLFTLMEGMLTQRNFIIRVDDGIFYIHKADAQSGKSEVAYGYGSNIADVPQTSLDIIQMVPFKYGMQISLANTLRQLLGVNATPDQARSAITLNGKRKDIIRALELINILDQPSFKGRHIGVFKTAFLPTDEMIKKLGEILAQEGISFGTSSKLALSVVALEKQGELIFFANDNAIIERAVFWAKAIDKPVISAEKQYYIYEPKYSRAIDMGESLQALIGGGSGGLANSTSAANENQAPARAMVQSASSATMKMVVDERANSLIFYTSGTEYQQLYPLIQRIDVMPKQVVLEVIIAEVKLTDTFKSGVDFTLTNQGATKLGGFDLSRGKTGLSYILSGTKGELTVNLLQTNSNVNVLSRPSLLVRDGVAATITVGDDIPTVGGTVSDDGVTTSSVVYRKTGVNLKVKPTINARGVIIMEIDQKISNTANSDSSVDGAPIIFERTITTEVIAESGQTIILGGLISENSSVSDSSVPFFSSMPIIGKLFDTDDESKDKTELVVLVTPKVVESSDQWQDIKAKLMSHYSEIKID